MVGIAIGVVIQSWLTGSPRRWLGDRRAASERVQTVLLYLFISVGFVMMLGIAIPMLVIANNTAALAVIAGGSVLGLALVFLVPIKIFEIGLFRSLVFLVLSSF